jgi:dihydroflavonol-4-reductase
MALNRDFWAGKRVCVTGGTGFLGYHLVRQLLNLRARVTVLALPPAADHPIRSQPHLAAVFGDICDLATVRRAVAGSELVFHTAGLVSAWGPALARMHAIHVEGTRNVLEALPLWARLVHTSSVVAVGASRTGEPLTEQSPFNLQRLRVAYVAAKRAAEELALDAAAHGRDVVVTNPGYLLGPEDLERSVMGRFCVRFWKGRVPFAPPGGLSLVDVRDVARGHLLSAERGRAGRRYILTGENQTFATFLARLAEAGGLRPRVRLTLPCWTLALLAGLAEGRAWLTGREPYPSSQHARMNRYFWFYHSERAAAELEYQARPLADTLADTHAWYAGRGLLPTSQVQAFRVTASATLPEPHPHLADRFGDRARKSERLNETGRRRFVRRPAPPRPPAQPNP